MEDTNLQVGNGNLIDSSCKPELSSINLDYFQANEKTETRQAVDGKSEMLSMTTDLEVKNYDDETCAKDDDTNSKCDQDESSFAILLPREHAPLDYLLSQIPRKAQRGMLQQIDLVLTSISANSDYIALGSNVGTVFLYHRKKQYMDRFKSENSADSVTCIKLHHGIDHQLAAGMSSGSVYILQIPASSTLGHSKQIQKFSVKDVHKAAVTCVEWSTNGMKLFSGDEKGTVLCTEVDFFDARCKSVILLIEESEIVQLHHCHKILLVSSKKRSAVCRTDDNDQMFQIGQKERKVLGNFGASFQPGLCKTEYAQLYAARPGYRVWKASIDGVVNTTYLYKDLLNLHHPKIGLLSFQSRSSASDQHQQFGQLLIYRERFLLTWNEGCLFLLNPENNSIIGTQENPGCIVDVCCSDDEIFLLRRDCDRLVIRIAEKSENIENKDLSHILQTFNQPEAPTNQSQGSSKPSVFHSFGTNIFGKINFKDKRTPSPQEKSTSTTNTVQEMVMKTQEVSPSDITEMLPPVVKLDSGHLDIKVYADDSNTEKLIHQQKSTGSVSDNQEISFSSQLSADSMNDNRSICCNESDSFSFSDESRIQGSLLSQNSHEESDAVKLEDQLTGFETNKVMVPTIEEKLVEKLNKNEKVEDIVFSQRLKKTKKKKRVGKKDTDKIIRASPSKADQYSESSPADSSSVNIASHSDTTEKMSSVSDSPKKLRLSPLNIEPTVNLTSYVEKSLDGTSEMCKEISHQISDFSHDAHEIVGRKNNSLSEETKLETLKSSESKSPTDVSHNTDVDSITISRSEEVSVPGISENVLSQKYSFEKEDTVIGNVHQRHNSDSFNAILRNFDDLEMEKRDEIIQKVEKQSATTENSSSVSEPESTCQPDKLSQLIEKTELEFARLLSRPRGDSGSDVPICTSNDTVINNTLPESERVVNSSPSATSTLYKTPDSSSSGDDFYRKYRGGSTCSSLVSSPDNPLMPESDEDEDKPNNYPQEEPSGVTDLKLEIPPDLPPSNFINHWIELSTQGNLYSLALSESHVWIADRSQNIYYSTFQGHILIWRKASGLAKQVAVSKSGNMIWRLYKNIAYAGTKITPKHPEGLKWVEAVRECSYVALDEHCAWYIKTNGEVLMQAGLSKDRPCYKSQRVVCPFHLLQLVCRSGVVWGLTEDCKLIYRSGITKDNPAGAKWLPCKMLSQSLLFSHLALGDKKTGWAIDVVGQIWFVSGVTMETPLGDEYWLQVPISEYYTQDVTAIDALRSLASKFDPQKLSYLLSTQRGGLMAAGSTGVWMCPEFKNILHVCRGTMEGHHWREIYLKGLALSVVWKHVCASTSSFDNGIMWIQQTNGDMLTFPTDTCKFTSISRPSMQEQFICLSACKGSVWGLTESGMVYIRCGIWPHCPEGACWVSLDLSQLGDIQLVHLSCGSVNVWAVDSHGSIYQRIGVMAPTSHSLNPAWLMVDTAPTGTVFTRVVTGPQDWKVWAIDNHRHVFVRDGVTETMPIGTRWMHVPGTPVTQLAISDNHVWALTPNGEVMCRYGIKKKNLAGDYWKKIPGIFSEISVSHLDSLWALDREGKLYHRQTKYIIRKDMFRDPQANDSHRSTTSMGSDDGDWELV